MFRKNQAVNKGDVKGASVIPASSVIGQGQVNSYVNSHRHWG